MKCLSVFAVLVWALLLVPMAHAQQNPDDQYLVIYGLMQQGDAFDTSGELRHALEDYAEAQSRLVDFQRVFPDWNRKIVTFRLSYLADKIAEIQAKLPSTNAPPHALLAPAATNTAVTAHATTTTGADAQLESQLGTLRGQVRQLQSDNETLQAKLKEALSVQPASVSPTQFDQLQDQLRSLIKENDLLKTSLAQGHGGTATVDTQAVTQLKLELADANQKLTVQTERADKLTLENQGLQTRLQSLLASADATVALRQENELLKKQMARLQAAPAIAAQGGSNAELADAHAQIATLQSAAEVNSLERMALENRIKQLQQAALKSAPSAALNQAGNDARIRELEKERDELRARLGDANRKLSAVTNQNMAAQIDALAQQVDTLRARIAVDEAQKVPYTPEELALFKQSSPSLTSNAEETPAHRLPGNLSSLAVEAQSYYSAKQFGKAEEDYQKILNQDENNNVALANLAAIELEENKLDEADKHIQMALAQSPNDAYNLTVLGRIRFAEAKYDDALDTLSRAEKLDPQNPDIQNYLGVTLAEKGLRAQAETALRRAVQLDPNYAAAHNNLAVIYLTQKPPMVELARWHYEKALAAGQPHNAALEKLLAEKGAPVNQ